MPHRQNRMRKAAVRFTAFMTLLLFLTTNVRAFPASVNLTPDSLPRKELNLEDVVLPSEIGKIQETYRSPHPSPVVILIQDAHAIPNAQHNIQRLIDFFQKQYGVGLVALEGANAPLDPQIFKSFPDKELLKKVFAEYEARGELTGGTAAAIFNEQPSLYQGIEDWNLYEEGVGFYLQAMEKESQILEKLQAASLKLQEEKRKIYSKELGCMTVAAGKNCR